MKFLEARALLDEFSSEVRRSLRVCVSAQVEPLDLFIRAEFAVRGIDCSVEHLPFGTLQQHIRQGSTDGDEIFVLFPWDLAPSLDWRSGVVEQPFGAAALLAQLGPIEQALASRNAPLFYVPATIPPVGSDASTSARLARMVEGAALRLGATPLPSNGFSLASYLSSGSPYAAARAGELAAVIVEALLPRPADPKKVLVTDLDGVMWHGVIGEDGIDGIRHAPEGEGFPHFIYQTFLRQLKAAGVVIAAVTRNDADLARAPFVRGDVRLAEENLVAILASYHDKSAQIANLATALNLPLDSFVFVDDNPVEIAEVSAQLPAVTAVRFPPQVEGLSPFLDTLSGLFARAERTSEDLRRTEMYRTLLVNPVPTTSNEETLRRFLGELRMRLAIADRTHAGRERAIQLINKTNQFNLNGVRFEAAEVESVLANGGRLFTATLADAHGEHGEILACLIGPDEEIVSLVMSCRVLQRRVEFAFVEWLSENVLRNDEVRMRHRVTERNTPLQHFLRDLGLKELGSLSFSVSREELLAAEPRALDLFEVSVVQ